MKSAIFFLVSLGFGFQQSWAGGSLIGNGGDTIFCKSSNLNAFQGHYTLDYLLKYKTEEALFDQEIHLEKTIQRLKEYFTNNYPEILPNFLDFMTNIRNSSLDSNRVWQSSTAPLNDIQDEDIVHQLPENCLREESNGELAPNLYQTVIRNSQFPAYQYLYSNEILHHQQINNPLQYSFFMVHEWLWDLTQDVEILRKLNWLFHSKKLTSFDRRRLIQFFDNLNIFQVKLPVCDKSATIKSTYSKSCQEMSFADLRKVETLAFTDIAPNFIFRIGDFYGFSKLKTLKLQGSNLEDALHPRIFHPLYKLEELDLSNSHLTTISSEIARDLGSLIKLDLSNNPLSGVPETLQFMRSLTSLSVSVTDQVHFQTQDQISNLPPNLQVLNLHGTNVVVLKKALSSIQQRRPVLIVLSVSR